MNINQKGDNRPPFLAESKVNMIAVELELDVDAETERVLLWREQELERAGYDVSVARELAERTYVDLHLAMDLVRRGCSPETAVRILV